VGFQQTDAELTTGITRITNEEGQYNVAGYENRQYRNERF